MNFIENILKFRDSDRTAMVHGSEINPTANSCVNISEGFLRQDFVVGNALCLANELDAVSGEKRPAFDARDCRRINSYSYKAVIENALRFACYLENEHISRVVIKTGRSPGAVTAALGVMFSGGVFAFLSDMTPQEHIDSAAADLGAACIVGDDLDFNDYPPADFVPKSRDFGEAVCAVFTSGSTGRPKGALLTYRGLCETIKWQTEYMRLPEFTNTASYAEFSFIASFWEIWYPLANGFTLHFADRKTRLDIRLLCDFVERNSIAYMFLPPDVAEMFTTIYKGGALRFLRVAGGRLRSCGEPRGYEILYSLGMSENSGSVTFTGIKTALSGDIPIGKPFGATEVYLIDGEMCVSGPSLFAGYAGREDLTSAALLPNPHARGRDLYARMYMSGDLAEWDGEGNLIYKGRRDWIVKINNVKTNPLETERVILSSEQVSEAVVLPMEQGDGAAFLACFYVGEIETEPLAAFAREKLLPTAVPSIFVKMPALPKNSNGKIDRAKLVLPSGENGGNSKAISAAEQVVAAAFEKILGKAAGTVGAEDGFISLGGSSLGMMRLQAELMVSAGLELRYSDIFTAQTPRRIAALNTAGQQQPAFAEAKPLYGKAYPLTAPERQMWLLWRTCQDNGRYTLRIRCDFDGELDRPKAEAALADLVKKNPILCSYYAQEQDNPVRYFAENTIAFSDFVPESFDLRESPLFAAALNGRSIVFTAHHIIADAAAMRIMMEDFWVFYGGGVPESGLQFHNLELREAATDFTDSPDEVFWANELSSFTYSPLPDEKSAGETKNLYEQEDLRGFAREFFAEQDGRRASSLCGLTRRTTQLCGKLAAKTREDSVRTCSNTFVLPFSAEECEKLKAIAAKANVTLFIMFTAAAAKLTALICGSDAACIGVPVSGRDMPQTVRTVGMLVRTLPLVIPTGGDFTETVKAANERFAKAFAHQNYPFERMNEKFGARYDVMVNLIPLPQKLTNTGGLNPRIIRGGYPAPPTKLVIDLREEEQGFSAVFTYDSFKDETAENWADSFKAILFGQTPEGLIIPEKADEAHESEETALQSGNNNELSAVWRGILGAEEGNFYELGGTSLKAIQIEEAMLLNGWFISAADILRLQEFSAIAKVVTPAEDIDWEAE
jgi:non-ribosomal peptide synthetase component F